MIRKLLLPALLVGLLGGCVTGYGYRDGYYYGQPSVEYRYHGYPSYGYPYGYGYYPYGERYYYNHYYSPYYGSPYYGRYPYYYNPYYYRHRKPPVTGTMPRPGSDHDRDNDRPPPWRDPDRRRDRTAGDALRERFAMPAPQSQQVRPAPRRESRAEGSSMRQVIRRTQEPRRRTSGDTQEP